MILTERLKELEAEYTAKRAIARKADAEADSAKRLYNEELAEAWREYIRSRKIAYNVTAVAAIGVNDVTFSPVVVRSVVVSNFDGMARVWFRSLDANGRIGGKDFQVQGLKEIKVLPDVQQ